jgi:hypothetical protein
MAFERDFELLRVCGGVLLGDCFFFVDIVAAIVKEVKNEGCLWLGL